MIDAVRSESERAALVAVAASARNQLEWNALSLTVRLWGRTTVTESGCWTWTGAGTACGGYGRLQIGDNASAVL